MEVQVEGKEKAWKCVVFGGILSLVFFRIKYKSGNGGRGWEGRQVRPEEALGPIAGNLGPS